MTLLPRVYCASKWERASMWRVLRHDYFDGRVEIVSTWHDSPTLQVDEAHAKESREGWARDFAQLRKCDHLLVYGEHKDRLNGTLMEVGYCTALERPISLVGNFPWGSWRHLRHVTVHSTMKEAVNFIVHHKELTR